MIGYCKECKKFVKAIYEPIEGEFICLNCDEYIDELINYLTYAQECLIIEGKKDK